MEPGAVRGDRARLEEALELAAAYYERVLWSAGVAAAVRKRLGRAELGEDVLRAFRIGYAPASSEEQLDDLASAGLSSSSLVRSGITFRSRRGHLQARFRSRVMFPIRTSGRLAGFAAMATNPGPSWPRWVVPPDGKLFERGRLLFNLDRARESIDEAREAIVVRDCAEVLRLDQRGYPNAVAIVRTQLSDEHAAQLADALRIPSTDLRIDREGEAPAAGDPLVIRPATPTEAAVEVDRPWRVPSRPDVSRTSATEIRPDPIVHRTPVQKAFLQATRLVLGAGIPLAWLAVVGVDLDAPGGAGTAFVGAIVGVAATYVVLALVSAVGGARQRARSRGRRMREPWARGASEWQPVGWTYHLLEDITIGASIASVGVCLILFFTIGGFTSDS